MIFNAHRVFPRTVADEIETVSIWKGYHLLDGSLPFPQTTFDDTIVGRICM